MSEQGASTATAQRHGARIVLADDDVLLREGLASLLHGEGFEVTASVGTADELLEAIRGDVPDLAIIDIRMPPAHSTEGLKAASVARQEYPDLGLMMLSAHVEVEQAMDLLAAGAGVGYLLKSRVVDVDSFFDAVRRVMSGEAVVDPSIVQELVASRRRKDPLEGLSAREREVLSLMAEGYSNIGIAHRIWVAEGTVEKHVRSIMMKLELPEAEDDHRRVLAVLRFLDSQ